jgi:hypothetical protein
VSRDDEVGVKTRHTDGVQVGEFSPMAGGSFQF